MFNLYCLSSSGDLLWSHHDPEQIFIHPAVADLDRDGDAEVVFHSLGYPAPGNIYCFDHDGTLKWRFTTFSHGYNQGPTIANVNEDPGPEILVGSTCDTLYCLDGSGNPLWKYAAAGDVSTPVVVDIDEDGDSEQEILFATTGGYVTCLDSQGHLIWQTEIEGMRLVGMAISDVDGDYMAEIIVNGYTVRKKDMLYCLERDGSVKWSQELMNDLGSIASTAAIDDINDDGKPEIAVFSNSYLDYKDSLWVLQDDGTRAKLLWQAPAADWWGGSGSGPVICDLDGDNYRELILMGSEYLGIYDGRDGSLLYTNPDLRSITRDEHPAVADVDHDGHAEIIATYRYKGVAMLEDDENWIRCRNQFSSHYYHITNIRNDLTVPTLEPHFWKAHNSWLAQGYHPQSCGVDIDPNVFDLKSRGRWVTCYIEPDVYPPEEIVRATILMSYGSRSVPAEPRPWGIGDHDHDGIPDLMVKFSRKAVFKMLAGLILPTYVTLEVSGEFTDGSPCYGTDRIRVIAPGRRHTMISETPGIPFGLMQNEPNPARDVTLISYSLPEDSHIRLELFDATGRSAAVLIDEFMPAGQHSVSLDTGRLSAGVYFYRLEAGGCRSTRKMTIME